MAAPVPVIDIQDFAGQSSKLIEACEEWGCFRIVNFDGILPRSLMLEMKAVVKSLLELPEEIKRRNVDVIAGSGYMAPSQINPLYEALGLYDMGNAEAVDSFCSKLDATPHQRAVVLKYAKAVNELMMYIGRRMGEGLGLSGISFEKWICQFRINKYTFTPETVGSPGVQIHTDSSFLTILQDDEIIGGLEVKKRCGTFVAIDPCPGTLLVNLGDIAAEQYSGPRPELAANWSVGSRAELPVYRLRVIWPKLGSSSILTELKKLECRLKYSSSSDNFLYFFNHI